MGTLQSDILSIDAFEHLKAYIQLEKAGKLASGGTQVTMRCPYCGDSRDPRNHHFYIGPDRKNHLVLSYHCFLCNTGGIINGKFFRDIGCFDTDLINEIIDYNKNVLKNSNYSKRIQSDYTKYISTPIITTFGNDENINKLNYLNHRLGINLQLNDLFKFKIILNLNKYLQDNKINFTTRYPDIMNQLSQYGLGFLSADNSHIVIRSVIDHHKLQSSIAHRYNVYSIYNMPDLVAYYIIPGLIDPFKPIKIYITEGVFDILGVYFNVIQDHNNCIFAAANGKNFSGIIEYLFSKIRIPAYNSKIFIYKDIDVETKKLTYVSNMLNKIKVPFEYHVNDMNGEKDFGVPRDRIIDKTIFKSNYL